MTVAHELAKAGYPVTLIDSAHQVGGLASAWTIGGIRWDRHYHVILLSDAELRGLLTELGLERDINWVQTKTGFFTGGRLHSLSSAKEFLLFPPLGLIDKLRLAATILYASRLTDWKPLERVSASRWLTQWSGTNTFETLWQPLLRAKLGTQVESASAVFIWSIIRRMYSARRAGLKKEMFGYVNGGYQTILDRFATELRERNVVLKTGRRICQVQHTGRGIKLEYAGGESEDFDKVVVTTPAEVTADLCGQLTADEQKRLRGITYQGIICASLLLRKPLADYYVTNVTEPWIPFTGVIEMSALVDRAQFGGNSLVYLPKYIASHDPDFQRSDEQIRADYIAALSRMYPHFSEQDIVEFKISRVRHVFAIPTLGYSERLPAIKTSIRNLFTLNSSQILDGTLNVNETVRLAHRGLAEIMANP